MLGYSIAVCIGGGKKILVKDRRSVGGWWLGIGFVDAKRQ
jgi:hypothetical protein